MKSRLYTAISLLLFLPSLACAHHAEFMEENPVLKGLSMPIHGLDHMLIAVAVGILAIQIGGRALWAIPATFCALITLGGILNISGVTIPFLEQGILASLVVFGGAMAWRKSISLLVGLCIVGGFAIFHGQALISPANNLGDFLLFASGCLTTAAFLQGLGMLIGFFLMRFPQIRGFRYAGLFLLIFAVIIALFPMVNGGIINLIE